MIVSAVEWEEGEERRGGESERERERERERETYIEKERERERERLMRWKRNG